MKKELEDLHSDLNNVTADVRESFAGLSPRELNWKPAPDRWSVGQCFEHLNAAGSGMIKAIEAKIDGISPVTFYERLPLLPKLFGRVISNAVSPEAERKMKAPKIFEPTQSDVDDGVVVSFLEFQPAIAAAMERCTDTRIIMGSPASAFITYSLLDAFTIVVRHEQRHVLQAKRVMEHTDFPHNTEGI
jgi:hypothetical protein